MWFQEILCTLSILGMCWLLLYARSLIVGRQAFGIVWHTRFIGLAFVGSIPGGYFLLETLMDLPGVSPSPFFIDHLVWFSLGLGPVVGFLAPLVFFHRPRG